jgi:hypothetical protein
VKLIKAPIPPGIGVGPVVPFPSTEAERTRVAKEAGKVSLLLAKPSLAQIALFQHLAENSPEGGYLVTKARWIDTILKATKDLSEADMRPLLHAFDWTERQISPTALRRELQAVLKAQPTDDSRK